MPTVSPEVEVEIAMKVASHLHSKWRCKDESQQFIGAAWIKIHEANEKNVHEKALFRAGILGVINDLRLNLTGWKKRMSRKINGVCVHEIVQLPVVSLYDIVSTKFGSKGESSWYRIRTIPSKERHDNVEVDPALSLWCDLREQRKFLSMFQRVILCLLTVEGMTQKEVAKLFGLHESRISQYVCDIYREINSSYIGKRRSKK